MKYNELILSKLGLFAMNKMAIINEYDWNGDYSKETIIKEFGKLLETAKENVPIDFDNTNSEELKTYGFKLWDQVDDKELYLIPIWYKNLLPKGLKVKCISGETFEVGKDILNNDIRFDCLAYGVEINLNDTIEDANDSKDNN